LEGRSIDESVALAHGILGQETVGPGGVCFALRTIPAMVELAELVALRAPRAWLVNFTNPAGMVTEALQQVLGDRAVGICDSPSGLCRRVAAALGRQPDELWFDYFGLNHLGWLKGCVTARATSCQDCSPTRRRSRASRRAPCSGRTGCARWA
jgi:6-phospho-beta-glucosidase